MLSGNGKQSASTDTTGFSIETSPCIAASLGVVTVGLCAPDIEVLKGATGSMKPHANLHPLVTGYVSRD
jgi:hypothetical protein